MSDIEVISANELLGDIVDPSGDSSDREFVLSKFTQLITSSVSGIDLNDLETYEGRNVIVIYLITIYVVFGA